MIASVEKVAHVFQEAVELIRVTLEHLVLHKVSPEQAEVTLGDLD